MTIATVGAARRARAVAACSFDVFDTFLLRACTTPDGVFERAYQRMSLSRSFPNVSESFVQHRIHAETRARRAAKEARGSSEVGIAEIYSLFPFRLFGLDRRALKDFVDAEFNAELELCRVNPEMLQQYLDMKRAGYRTGFISDTYWSAEQLGRLLRACSPDLGWDFLYASCENGTSKSDALFARYLSEQGFDPTTALHIGDNEAADIKGAQRHGIRARYYPQASLALAAQLQRESSVFTLLCPEHSPRLDQGSRTLRRMVAAQAPEKSPAFHLGVTTVGPVMAAFDAFIEHHVARLRQDKAKKVAVAFLGRDGYLPHRIWQACVSVQFALLLRQALHRRLQHAGDFVALDHAGRIGLGVGHLGNGVDIFRARAAAQIDAAIGDDAIEPGGEFCAAMLPAAAMGPDLEQGVLHHVFGIGAAFDDAQRDGVGAVDVPRHQKPERRLVVGGETVEQFLVFVDDIRGRDVNGTGRHHRRRPDRRDFGHYRHHICLDLGRSPDIKRVGHPQSPTRNADGAQAKRLLIVQRSGPKIQAKNFSYFSIT